MVFPFSVFLERENRKVFCKSGMLGVFKPLLEYNLNNTLNRLHRVGEQEGVL